MVKNGIIRLLYFDKNLFELNLWLLILKIKVYKVIIAVGQSSNFEFLLISIVNNSPRGENHELKYNKT